MLSTVLRLKNFRDVNLQYESFGSKIMKLYAFIACGYNTNYDSTTLDGIIDFLKIFTNVITFFIFFFKNIKRDKIDSVRLFMFLFAKSTTALVPRGDSKLQK